MMPGPGAAFRSADDGDRLGPEDTFPATETLPHSDTRPTPDILALTQTGVLS